MKKLNARFVEKTVAAIYRFYPRSVIKGIMLTGSHATGEACPDSDIDVLLLSNLSNRQTMETLTFKGHTYQFIIVPSNKIYELVYKDYMTAHFVFLSLFEKGIILYDEDGKLGKVRSVVLSSKPWSLKDHDILTLRASVTSALETLRKSKNPQSGLCTASEAVIMTARLICGRKSYSGKHLDKILSTYPRGSRSTAPSFGAVSMRREWASVCRRIRNLASHLRGLTEQSYERIRLVRPAIHPPFARVSTRGIAI